MYIVEVYIEHANYQLDRPFSYVSNDKITSGVRVTVPFNNQELVGYVNNVVECSDNIETLEEEYGYELKSIINVIDELPLLNKELLEVASYLQKVSFAPKISCLSTMLPSKLKPKSNNKPGKKYNRYVQAVEGVSATFTTKQQQCYDYLCNLKQPVKLGEVPYSAAILKKLAKAQAIDIIDVEEYRNPYEHLKLNDNSKPLTPKQQTITDEIYKNSFYHTSLIYGVTGSGKTEIYLNLSKRVIDDGKTVVMLVPEISLTPMMVKRFKERFGQMVAVLHSKLSQGEKYDEYLRIVEKKVKIVVGARSAIFAPLENIGLIILDEEHDSSYKQENSLRYHARDIAIFRAKNHNCPLVLASATPSIESFARAKKGTYKLYELKDRINQQPMPKCQIIDMGNEIKKGNYSLFSTAMINRIKQCIQAKEQVILLLNRRGYASYLQCRHCGYVVKCPNCDVSLTYHKDTNTMKCHYCDHQEAKATYCPDCKEKLSFSLGYGTQKVEEMLYELIEGVKIVRMDVDTTKTKGAHEKLLNAFENKEANILLGTQMVAKGLDFSNVTFVGVINADNSLHLTDFRASERTFQLLCQVSGRSGRGDKKGDVIIQTFNPDHYAITTASKHDYNSFYEQEIKYRYYGNYPPFCRLISIEIKSKSEELASTHASNIVAYLKNNSTNTTVLGPSVALISKINNMYRYKILIKYTKSKDIIDACKMVYDHYNNNKVSVLIDLNPYTQA